MGRSWTKRMGSKWALAVALVSAPAVSAQVHETAKLTGDPNVDDVESWEQFGYFVSAVDGFAWIGEPLDDGDEVHQGAVFGFERTASGWTLGQFLSASEPIQSELYGDRIAFDDHWGFVGTWNDKTKGLQVGSVHVLTKVGTTWSETQKEHEPRPRNRKDRFGYGLAVDGDRLVVGAPGDDDAGTDEGAAYVYHHTAAGWSLEQKLVPSHQPLTDWGAAGYSVALAGDVAVLGSVGERAFVFRRGSQGWVQEAVLAHPSGLHNERFGWSVGIDGDTIAIGATVLNGVGRPGSVVVFQRIGQPGNWVPVQVLQASNALSLDRFGVSLDLLGDRLVVGAERSNLYGIPGNAYLFERGPQGWKETALLAASDGGPTWFGAEVRLCESYVLVGDWFAEGPIPGVHSGAAYVYDLPFGETTCDGVPNSTQQAATLRATGCLRAAAGALELRSAQLPPHQLGYFLLSSEAGFVSGPGGSQGNLCLGGTIGRFHASLQSTGSQGTMQHQVDTDALPLPPPAEFLPGETWHFQAWYRDQNPTSTSNFSDGRAITFR